MVSYSLDLLFPQPKSLQELEDKDRVLETVRDLCNYRWNNESELPGVGRLILTFHFCYQLALIQSSTSSIAGTQLIVPECTLFGSGLRAPAFAAFPF